MHIPYTAVLTLSFSAVRVSGVLDCMHKHVKQGDCAGLLANVTFLRLALAGN